MQQMVYMNLISQSDSSLLNRRAKVARLSALENGVQCDFMHARCELLSSGCEDINFTALHMLL